jgi:hypothetical protein
MARSDPRGLSPTVANVLEASSQQSEESTVDTRQPNRITIYSSGMADFVRSYALTPGQETRISIPVKEDHVGDVLDSLRIYGHVRLASPPSFTPRGADAGILAIDPGKAQQELLTHLSGADLRVTPRNSAPVEGRLVGRDTRRRDVGNGATVIETVVSVLEPGGSIRKFLLDDLAAVEFTDETVRAEIRKALDANSRKIKQGSTSLELALEPLGEDEAEALVQYMVPMAAPKFTYRISTSKDREASLEGLAVVDNNTDEDLDGFLVTVVNGQPISFTTDLAAIRVPARGNVNVVADAALGAMEVEEGVEVAPSAPAGAGRRMAMYREEPPARPARAGGRGGYGAPTAARADLMHPGAAVVDMGVAGPPATRDEAEAQEVADFQLWSSRAPMTIRARKSALVPLFTADVPGAKPVLIYNPLNHPTRPFRAVRFTNATSFSLSRGVASIFEEGVNVGKGILDDAKPGDVKLIPHQLETGVRVSRQSHRVESRLAHVAIARGASISETVQKARATYVLRNAKDEAFVAYIVHHAQLGDGGKLRVEAGDRAPQRLEKVPAGWRVELTLGPRQELSVKATEERKLVQRVALNEDNFLATLGPIEDLKDHPQVRRAVAIQGELAALEADLKEANGELAEQLSLQERVKGFLASVPEGQQRDDWINDIAVAEAAIRAIRRTKVPGLYRQIRAKKDELRDVLHALAADWNATPDRTPVED